MIIKMISTNLNVNFYDNGWLWGNTRKAYVRAVLRTRNIQMAKVARDTKLFRIPLTANKCIV